MFHLIPIDKQTFITQKLPNFTNYKTVGKTRTSGSLYKKAEREKILDRKFQGPCHFVSPISSTCRGP